MRAALNEKVRFRAASWFLIQNCWGREAVCLLPGDLVGDSLAKDVVDFE
jgi:hypothetical protein